MSTFMMAVQEHARGMHRWHVHRRRVVIACLMLAVLLWLFATVAANGQDPDGPKLGTEKVSAFMRQKLMHSQKLLEALALEDFEGIAKNSQAISLLSQDEIWQVLQSADYLQYSKEFRRAADAVTESGRKRNLDGAALGYVDMTLKCVQCHKYVRGIKTSDTPELRKTQRK